ncbi:MAG TPA: hypothetical protein VD905_04940, partial [Flavobacteriales bacterium]|nr:hypothetical protein [Flavobacteriales bacterium]
TLAEEGFIYSCYYIFFSFLCLQALVVVIMIILTLMKKRTNFELLNHKKMSGRDYRLMALVLLVFASPLLAAPCLLGKPFLDMMNALHGFDYWMMWSGFVLDIGQQLFIMFRIAFAKGYQKEINDRQNKLMKDWEPVVNMMFFLGVVGTVMVMFL